uniref:Disease resistance protein RPM1 n=1 Tax=Aegilops tauschii subsp. strangulata TaxID=200361 RepID=A0A453Q705_AEGTS
MAMEAALVSVATGVLKPVIGKLTVLLGNEYKRFKTVRKEIKSLTNELAAMEAFLLKMSEDEDPDVQDKVWMNEVRELSYDMEDTIDDFMQSIGDKDEKPDGFIEKIKSSLGKLGKMKARRRIGREIQDLKKQIKEVGDRNTRYKGRQTFTSTKNETVDPRALAIFEHASNLVGIDGPKAEIIKLLAQEDGRASTQQQLKIVSIVGSGGMGKTTLANQVYQELKEQFECWAFISVSRSPNMMNILRTILSEVSGQDYSMTEAGSVQILISKINDFLLDKRYFVVVDDIWDVDTWDIIKCAFPATSSTSRIITTTRINNVAHSCCSSFNGRIYNIRALDMVHSRQLFHTRLFKSDEDCPSYLQEISEQILKKCDGLPLAIIAISGLLANTERTENMWNQVKDSIGRALERNTSVEGMMKILSLSYFDLPAYLKTCLLYLSIYQEDSTIEKEDLIRRWIAEGFIHREGRYTAYELGERCFNELLNRGLIQPEETNEYGIVKSCRVHDTILDFIISKSTEENFVTLLGVPILTIGNQSNVVRRLCLQGVEEGNSTILAAGLVLSHVRSFTMVRGLLEIPSLEEFRHLRVLNLKECSELKDHHLENIVRLFQLRYLNLEGTYISKLPEQIGRLGCLEVLDLRMTSVLELPASIVNLRKLMHLLVNNDVKFPDGIAKMQALETLEGVRAYIQPFDFLCGLGQLKNLRNLVDLEFYCHTEEHNKAIVSSLCKLGTHNLRSLTIEVPTWVGSLRNLQRLRLIVEGLKQDDLCTLGALPSLLVLYLDGTPESNGKLRINGEVGFRFLNIFIYDACLTPVDLMFGTGSMPKLEKIELNYIHVIEANSLGFGIENLPCLTSVKCIGVDGDDGIVEAVKTAMERGASTHPNHPSLLFGSF